MSRRLPRNGGGTEGIGKARALVEGAVQHEADAAGRVIDHDIAAAEAEVGQVAGEMVRRRHFGKCTG